MPKISESLETRRGSPFDDKPSTNKLHHFVRKKKKKKNVTPRLQKKKCDIPGSTGSVKDKQVYDQYISLFPEISIQSPPFPNSWDYCECDIHRRRSRTTRLVSNFGRRKKTFRIEQMGQMCTSLK